MPLYEYRCTQCGHQFEKIQSFSSTPEAVCPLCKGALERPLTAPAFNFKGAGWYVNDYASKPSSGSGKASGEASSTAPAADAKPAATEAAAKPAEAPKPAPPAPTT